MPETETLTAGTPELIALTQTNAARISDDARALGLGTGRGRVRRLEPAEAALLVVVRRLMALGVNNQQAVACAGTVPLAELRRIIAEDTNRWLVVLPDPERPGELLCRIADPGEMFDLAEIGGGTLGGLRIVDLRDTLREVFTVLREAQQRAEATGGDAAAKFTGQRVRKFQGDRQLSGVFLRRSGRVDIVRSGAGLSVELSPDELREIADALERVAAEIEAGPEPHGGVN